LKASSDVALCPFYERNERTEHPEYPDGQTDCI
jgi:hypothetical protein